MIKLYHGGDKDLPLFHNGVLWLTDSLEYAEDYAQENTTPTIYTVYIDETKLKYCAFSDYGDDVDPYNPSNYVINDMISDGYNCYSLYYDEDDAEGIALFDKAPIIKIHTNVSENRLHKIIHESIKTFLINEAYNNDIYHYTSFEKGLSIIMQNNLIADANDLHNDSSLDDLNWSKYNGNGIPSLSFTRQPNPKHFLKDINDDSAGSYGEDYIAVRFTIDADKIMSSLRYAKLIPFRWYGCEQYKSEFEERLYGVNVEPLDKYCKQVDLYIYDISGGAEEYIWDEFYDKAVDMGYDENSDDFPEKLNELALDYIINESLFKNKVVIHDMRK